VPLVQFLQAQLPPMQLDGQLINVTGDFLPLRFVLGQLAADLFGPKWCFQRRGSFRLSSGGSVRHKIINSTRYAAKRTSNPKAAETKARRAFRHSDSKPRRNRAIEPHRAHYGLRLTSLGKTVKMPGVA
jgi:hypothetical protein